MSKMLFTMILKIYIYSLKTLREVLVESYLFTFFLVVTYVDFFGIEFGMMLPQFYVP